MSKKRIKTDAVAHWVPANRDEVNEAIAQVGRDQRERERISADMNDRIAAIKAEYDAQAKPLGERISELSKGVQLWCEANRASLTKDGKVKFHEFATGIVKWRLTPWSASISKAGEVLALLRAKAMEKYIRTKEEIDKPAILADPDAVASVKGIALSQGEDFVIKPFATEIEEVQ